MRLAVFLGVFSLFLVSGDSVARAGGGCDTFSGLPALYGYGFSGTLYGLGRIPVPPYFALHPPVYYSEQVARPYGLSPFAYRSAPVESHRIKPTVITNPFVKRTPAVAPRKKPAPKDTVTARGEVIINPFFEQTLEVVQD